jgi:hypothetical protein
MIPTNPSLDMEVLAFAGIKLCETSLLTPSPIILRERFKLEDSDFMEICNFIRENKGQYIVFDDCLYIIFKDSTHCLLFRKLLQRKIYLGTNWDW